MIRAAIAVLSLLSLALATTIGLEVQAGRKSPLPQTAESRSVPMIATSAAPPNREKAWVEPVRSRPVFASSRRPPAVTPAVDKLVTPAKLPRLAGIMVNGTRRTVIFASEGEKRPVVVAEGGEVAGFKVEQIEIGQVTVTSSAGRQVLRPSFDLKAPSPAAPTAAPAPPVVASQAAAFNGPPGLDRMPAIVGTGPTQVTPTLPGLPSLNNLIGIPGMALPDNP